MLTSDHLNRQGGAKFKHSLVIFAALTALLAVSVVAAINLGLTNLPPEGGIFSTAELNLEGELPIDVQGNGANGASDYDVYSWLNFIALNSPVDGSVIGENGDKEPKWATWMEDFQILVQDGQTPPAWGSPRNIPPACQALTTTTEISRVLTHASKAAGVVEHSNQAQAGPLIDQNGAYVRYEILVNEQMYNYILQNKLYNLAGLNAISGVSFPKGDLSKGELGAIMLKAAWKVMGTGDDPSLFHTSDSYVYDQEAQTCKVENLGLVGFHISAKTVSAPQWIWSTFEHVNNAPNKASIDKTAHYNFYNPNCITNCRENALPITPWNPSRPNQAPVQLVRDTPIGPNTAKINTFFQSQLTGVNPKNVWANYMLVGTQFPQSITDPVDPTGRPFPMYLANTTIESFMQGNVPMVSSSCVSCHNRATATPSAKSSDFSYILSRVTAKF